VPQQQWALRRIYELREAGKSLRQIRAELAAQGITLSHVSVGNILAQNTPSLPRPSAR
jgi:hypothetical protein